MPARGNAGRGRSPTWVRSGANCDELRRRAHEDGYDKLSAFTHAPGYFSQMGFSIVPHLWVPEKVFSDCVKCPMFRRCGQYAMVAPLDAAVDQPQPAVLVAPHA